MGKRPKCFEPGEGLVHKGFDKTNRTTPSLRPGNPPLEIWVCQCGAKEHQVVPGKAKRDW
jgi:hypothetical protein